MNPQEKDTHLLKELKKVFMVHNSIESFQLEIAQRNVPWRLLYEPYVKPTPQNPNIAINLLFGSLFSFFETACPETPELSKSLNLI